MLVPEIALTLWIGRQCRAWFGARFEGVAVLHSALTDVERAREWWRVRNGDARVVVGTRSAVFAPLENLGLIIVDEEQENSYKQEETPRYHGRDVAIVRAKIENALALLGFGDSFARDLPQRGERKVRAALRWRRGLKIASSPKWKLSICGRNFSRRTKRTRFPSALHDGDSGVPQRRDASFDADQSPGLFLVGAMPQLRQFRAVRQLQHFADISQESAIAWSATTADTSRGAENVSRSAIRNMFIFLAKAPSIWKNACARNFLSARIARLDRDTTRTKRQYQQTLGAFAAGALDILVGTQMLAKGHDFQRVTLVGVVSADGLLSMPDFRAAERTFQLLTQVAGRAGRGELHGRVLIQTFYPDHYAIQDAVQQDYLAFFEREMNFRRTMGYPPLTSLANVIVRDTNLEKAIRWSRKLSEYFSPHNGKGARILGPASAPLARLKKEYRFQFLLKSLKRSVLTKLLTGALDYCETNEIPDTAVLVDMDPLSLM